MITTFYLNITRDARFQTLPTYNASPADYLQKGSGDGERSPSATGLYTQKWCVQKIAEFARLR